MWALAAGRAAGKTLATARRLLGAPSVQVNVTTGPQLNVQQPG